MEALTDFLKFSTVLDWLVIFSAGLLIVIAFVMLFVLRTSKPFLIVVASAAIPIAGGLLSTFLKYQQAQRAFEEIGDVAAVALQNAQAEARIISYIALGGGIIITILGLTGVVTKRRAAP